MRGFIVSLYAVVDYPFEKRFFEVVSSANFGLNRKRLLELSITFVHKCVQVCKQFSPFWRWDIAEKFSVSMTTNPFT